MDEPDSRVPTGRVAVLGLITISVYGTWYYAFGVLLDPIIADTGWAEPTLTAAFGASIFVGGFGSLAGGWLLDRMGSRLTFALAASLGAVLFQLAASARSAGVFAVTAAAGGAVVSALGMYHITQTVAVRISPGATTRAIALLTIWGAFASAVYVPVTGWIVEPLGWRMTLRLITGSAVVALLAGVVFLDTGRSGDRRLSTVWSSLGGVLKSTEAVRFIAAIGLIGIGASTLLVYQVPAMTAAGLPLAAASFWAGFRGFSQLAGRLPLMPLVRRLGVSGSFRTAIAATAVGMIILSFAGNVGMAALFAVTAGFGVGAISPLQGMQIHQLFGEQSLGTAMGLVSLVFLVVGSAGPALAGVVADTTESRAVPVMGAALVLVCAAAITPASR